MRREKTTEEGYIRETEVAFAIGTTTGLVLISFKEVKEMHEEVLEERVKRGERKER